MPALQPRAKHAQAKHAHYRLLTRHHRAHNGLPENTSSWSHFAFAISDAECAPTEARTACQHARPSYTCSVPVPTGHTDTVHWLKSTGSAEAHSCSRNMALSSIRIQLYSSGMPAAVFLCLCVSIRHTHSQCNRLHLRTSHAIAS